MGGTDGALTRVASRGVGVAGTVVVGGTDGALTRVASRRGVAEQADCDDGIREAANLFARSSGCACDRFSVGEGAANLGKTLGAASAGPMACVNLAITSPARYIHVRESGELAVPREGGY